MNMLRAQKCGVWWPRITHQNMCIKLRWLSAECILRVRVFFNVLFAVYCVFQCVSVCCIMCHHQLERTAEKQYAIKLVCMCVSLRTVPYTQAHTHTQPQLRHCRMVRQHAFTTYLSQRGAMRHGGLISHESNGTRKTPEHTHNSQRGNGRVRDDAHPCAQNTRMRVARQRYRNEG